jgi:exodeoxyribonuclease-1
MNYIWLDTESSGSSTAFDQILEVGMVLTDDKLQEKERWSMRSRLKEGIIPNLGALNVTGFTVKDLTQTNQSHYQMVEAMENVLNRWGNAYVFTYNGTNFDYPLIQKTLYKCLRPSYITNTNGKKHGDILNVVRAAKLVNPDVIETPMSEKGNPVFKLDKLMKHEGAHGALEDTVAMLDLSRIVYQKANSIWRSSLLTLSKSDTDQLIKKEPMFCQLQWFYGRLRKYLVHHYLYHPVYTAWSLCWDLQWNPADYFNLSHEDLKAALQKSPKVLRTLKTNKSEVLLNFRHVMNDEPYSVMPEAELRKRIKDLEGNNEFRERVSNILQEIHDDKEKEKTEKENLQPEEQLYNGFPSDEDKNLMEKFHKFNWEDRVMLLDKFKDSKYSFLAEKFIFEERPDVLPESILKKVKRGIAERIFSKDKQNWTTLPEFYKSIDDMRSKNENDETKLKLLDEYDAFAQSIEKKYEAV